MECVKKNNVLNTYVTYVPHTFLIVTGVYDSTLKFYICSS